MRKETKEKLSQNGRSTLNNILPSNIIKMDQSEVNRNSISLSQKHINQNERCNIQKIGKHQDSINSHNILTGPKRSP